jgi:hypothetical protein
MKMKYTIFLAVITIAVLNGTNVVAAVHNHDKEVLSFSEHHEKWDKAYQDKALTTYQAQSRENRRESTILAHHENDSALTSSAHQTNRATEHQYSDVSLHEQKYGLHQTLKNSILTYTANQPDAVSRQDFHVSDIRANIGETSIRYG